MADDKTANLDLDADAANADWLRAARLKKLGTPEAEAKLAELEDTPMVEVEPSDFERGDD